MGNDELLLRKETKSLLKISSRLLTKIESDGILPVLYLGPKSPRHRREDVMRLVGEGIPGAKGRHPNLLYQKDAPTPAKPAKPDAPVDLMKPAKAPKAVTPKRGRPRKQARGTAVVLT